MSTLKVILMLLLLFAAMVCLFYGIIISNPNNGGNKKKGKQYILLSVTTFIVMLAVANMDFPQKEDPTITVGNYSPAPATAFRTPSIQYPELTPPNPEPTSPVGQPAPDPGPGSQVPPASGERAKEGRATADAFMERHYGDFNYSLISANESNSDKYYYTYHVQALSNIFSMEFDLPVDYEVSAGSCYVPGGGLDSWFSSTSPLWDDNTVRVWNLEGNWTYSDGNRDYYVTISNVNGEQFQMEYQLYDSGEEFISNGRESFVLVPRMGNVEGYSSWYIQDASEGNSDYDLSFIVYPFDQNPDGTVGILAVEGYELSRS